MVDVAIFVGHSRLGDKCGAIAVDGTDEYHYNKQVAALLRNSLDASGVTSQVIDHYPHRGYGASMRWVGQKCYELNAKCAIELHFNSFHRAGVSGHEWLIYPRSVDGHALADALERAMLARRPNAPRRGVKELRPDENGFGFVANTPCPAVVCEPFFGSNAQECLELISNPDELAAVYHTALVDYLGIDSRS